MHHYFHRTNDIRRRSPISPGKKATSGGHHGSILMGAPIFTCVIIGPRHVCGKGIRLWFSKLTKRTGHRTNNMIPRNKQIDRFLYTTSYLTWLSSSAFSSNTPYAALCCRGLRLPVNSVLLRYSFSCPDILLDAIIFWNGNISELFATAGLSLSTWCESGEQFTY